MATGKRQGCVVPEELLPYLDVDECHVEPVEGGGFVVISDGLTCAAFFGDTEAECWQWLRDQGYQEKYTESDYLPEDPPTPEKEIAFLQEVCGPDAVITRIG